jgi:transposase
VRRHQVERDIAQIDAAFETIVTSDKTLCEKAAILISIPGIAKVTAFAMPIEMPELGSLSAKHAASLAGLAPISRRSGKWQGKYRELIAKGKCKKLAITTVMRELVIMVNALLRDNRKWTETRA